MPYPVRIMFMGKEIEALTREQLIEAVKCCMQELEALRKEQRKMSPFINWDKYFRTPPNGKETNKR